MPQASPLVRLRTALAPLVVVLAAGALSPAAVQAHGGVEHGTGAEARQHMEQDLAGVSMGTLERSAARITRKLGRRPGTAPVKARAAAAGSPDRVGTWGPVTGLPVLPVFTALLPNGKVLMWDSVGDGPAESYDDQSFTRAAVWDPATDTSTRVDVQGYNIFCAGFVQMADGDVLVAGGNKDRTLGGIRQTHVFDWRTETWRRGPDMAGERWYPSLSLMPDGTALTIGGGPSTAEVLTVDQARSLTGVQTPSSRLYPFLQTGTDGRGLLFGPGPGTSLVDTDGQGSIEATAQRDGIDRQYGSFAFYDVGKVLVAGGGAVFEDWGFGVPTRTAATVTTNTLTGRPQASTTGSMNTRRRQFQLVTLVDGTVLAVGGMTTNEGSGLVDLRHPALEAERWDPATGRWTTMASQTVARQYHSTAFLLPDGRVFSGGGGICSACVDVGYFRRDYEIYTPPYLYAKDGSGRLADRPVITGAPAEIGYAQRFTARTPDAGRIAKATLVRLGAPTHGVDQSQRHLPLEVTRGDGEVTLGGPENPAEAPAGTYMLFLVDDAGVPSVSRMVRVTRPTVTPPATGATTNLALGRPAAGPWQCQASEGPEQAVNGSVGGGYGDKFCSFQPNATLQVDLGAARAVDSVRVSHAQAGGEPAAYNTRDFDVQTSDDGTTWATAASITGNAAATTTVPLGGRSARYLRIAVLAPDQGVGFATRIYELEVLGAAAAADPGDGAPLVAYSGGAGTGRAQRFQAGVYRGQRGNLGQVGVDAIRSATVAPGWRALLCDSTDGVDCTWLSAGRYPALPDAISGLTSSLLVEPAD